MPSTFRSRLLKALAQVASIWLIVAQTQAWAVEEDAREFFELRIRPVLVEHCYECHNTALRAEGGLALDCREGLLRGGDSGPAINSTTDNAASSLLLRALRHEGELRMPKEGPKLSEQVIADFATWIASGAYDPREYPSSDAEVEGATSWQATLERRKQWWSFLPISSPQLPEVKDRLWSTKPIDRFLLARMEAAGLSPAPEADRPTLIRRVTLTLTGLPPTPAEVEAFVADSSADAYEKVVDRLLASPQFGERWARHWMDWFRYADSHGSEGDPTIPNAWRYRDYLIRALNADVPYDQLVREHIAGDLLPNPRVNQELGLNESAIGVSHYRFVEHGYAPTDPLEELVRTTENQIDVVSKAFLGLTVSCARCHDHKFDPVSQADFYALYGIMTSCRPAQITIDTEQRQATHQTELRTLKRKIKSQLADSWLNSLGDVTSWLESSPKALSDSERKDKEAAKQWSGTQQQVNAAIDQGLLNPLYIWLRLRDLDSEAFSEEWSSLSRQVSDSRQRLEARRSANYLFAWNAADSTNDPWYHHGSGLDGKSAAAGAFHIDPEGDRIVANIYPAGVYSHLLSSKHSGLFTSPTFPVEAGTLWIRALGSQARTRYVMQSYARVSGPIYQSHNLDSDEFQWLHWDMRYWEGDRTYLEFATGKDIPVEIRDQDRSWFGVSAAVAVRDGEAAPQNEPAEYIASFFDVTGLGEPDSRQALLQRYSDALRDCIEAWRNDTMSDEQANFLSYFVRQQLLPNSLAKLPDVAPTIEAYRRLEADIPVPVRAPGIVEAEIKDQPLFVRGNHKQPGDVVRRRYLEAFNQAPYENSGSGRLQLADSIVAADNPLTSRIIVNRLWHHVFGRGLVATPDNFGHLGAEPTHPDLLNYLVANFNSQGQSLKFAIRAMVTSRAFQQASNADTYQRVIDPNNDLLSHTRVQRLEAEALRDTLLQLSGELDRVQYGPPVDGKQPRRGVYVRIQRNSLDPFLSSFDAPVPFSTKGRRDVTNVPAQSLALMNDAFVRSCAEKWADRIASDSSLTDDKARIDRLFVDAFARYPTLAEQATTLEFLMNLRQSDSSREQALNPWHELAHALIGFKEFAYIR